MGAYGESMRPFCGNTNLAVLEHWIEQASAALAATRGDGGGKCVGCQACMPGMGWPDARCDGSGTTEGS